MRQGRAIVDLYWILITVAGLAVLGQRQETHLVLRKLIVIVGVVVALWTESTPGGSWAFCATSDGSTGR